MVASLNERRTRFDFDRIAGLALIQVAGQAARPPLGGAVGLHPTGGG